MGSSDPHYMQPRRSHSCEGLMHKWLYCSYMEADKEDTNPNRRAHTITESNRVQASTGAYLYLEE